jgi:iron complex outermembrane receptor protein
VINIITKKAKNTQGGLLSGNGGNMRGGSGLRYGVDLGNQAYLNVFGRYSEYENIPKKSNQLESADDSQLRKIGFRFEKDIGTTDKLTVQGDAFTGFSGGAQQNYPYLSAPMQPVVTPPYLRWVKTNLDYSGHYLQGRWEHRIDQDSSTVLRLYWNRNERKSPAINSSYQIDTADVDFQHNIRLNDRHNVVWGSGVRVNMNETHNSLDLGWTPNHRVQDIYSLFAQDEITLVPERWKLTLGSKFEHNVVTGFEWQPNARLAWTPIKQHAFWASIARSVRTPNLAEQDVNYNYAIIPPFGGGPAQPNNPATLITLGGNKAIGSEKMLSYELGWRGELGSRLKADVAFYYYDYHNALSITQSPLDFSHIGSGYLLQNIQFTNYGGARSYGGEAGLDWQVTDEWKLRASYAHTQQEFDIANNAPIGTAKRFESSSPTHQVMLWSMYQLTPQINFDLNWRYVGAIEVETQPVASYHELDARLAWKLSRSLELAIVGRNLINDEHLEFGSLFFSAPTPVQREAYATLRWDF